MTYLKILEKTRLIAILRGITPSEVLDVAKILVKNGFKILEVPLNSPEAFKSIEILTTHYKDDKNILIGAGTVCSKKNVKKLYDTKAKLVISPNVDVKVIKQSKKLNMVSMPGFLTPSEAYSAINAGADCLKLFPIKHFGINYYKDIKTILPPHIPIIAVGGIDESNIEEYLQSGIKYFGLGSSLYKPNMDLNLLKAKAKFFMKAVKNSNV